MDEIDLQASINQNLYSTPSRSLLRAAPDRGQSETNCLKNLVELRTGTIDLNWKSTPGCWTNNRKRTGLHCCRAGEWEHEITVNRGPQCTTAWTRRERSTSNQGVWLIGRLILITVLQIAAKIQQPIGNEDGIGMKRPFDGSSGTITFNSIVTVFNL